MKVIDYCVCCGSDNVKYTQAGLAPFIGARVFGWMPRMAKTNEGQVVMTLPICKSIRCQDCDYVGSDIRFDDDEMGRLYANYRDEQYVTLREQFEQGYARLNAELEGDVVPYFDEMEAFILDDLPGIPKRVLDWGGNNGINTPFKEKSETVHIFDVGGKPPKYGTAVLEPAPPYDLIVCSNTLEHVSYPRRMLNEMRAYMTKDTLLYIEIPIEELWMDVWHEHINKFSAKSLDAALKSCKLELVRYKQCPPPRHGYSHLAMANVRLADAD